MDKKQSTSKAVALNNSTSLSIIKTAEDIERFVEYIANSETYNKAFTVNSEENGKPVRIVDRNAIATSLLLGSELGFKPMESIMLGRRLNDEAVVKVYRGRDLGLSEMASIQNIHVWKNQTGAELVYTGIHVIYKILTEANVVKKVIDDGTKPFYFYTDMKSGEEIEFDERYHICTNTGISAKEIEIALQAKRIPVTRKSTRRGLVELTRESTNEVIAIPYTLMQAVDAGLYKGVNSFGEEVKGKSNWNSHPATHLIKMSVMAGARMIIGDRLQGSFYIAEELPINERQVEDTTADTVD